MRFKPDLFFVIEIFLVHIANHYLCPKIRELSVMPAQILVGLFGLVGLLGVLIAVFLVATRSGIRRPSGLHRICPQKIDFSSKFSQIIKSI
jgi:hypothetical protein